MMKNYKTPSLDVILFNDVITGSLGDGVGGESGPPSGTT